MDSVNTNFSFFELCFVSSGAAWSVAEQGREAEPAGECRGGIGGGGGIADEDEATMRAIKPDTMSGLFASRSIKRGNKDLMARKKK